MSNKELVPIARCNAEICLTLEQCQQIPVPSLSLESLETDGLFISPKPMHHSQCSIKDA